MFKEKATPFILIPGLLLGSINEKGYLASSEKNENIEILKQIKQTFPR